MKRPESVELTPLAERLVKKPSGIGKTDSLIKLLARVCEAQHAELLLLSAEHAEGADAERYSALNDDVRSILDQFWRRS